MWIILRFPSNILSESYSSSHFDPHPVMLVAIPAPTRCQQKAQLGENRGKNSVTFFKNITRTSNTTELQGFALAPGWRSVTWDSQPTQCHLRQSADPVSPETVSRPSVTWDRQLTQCHLRQSADPVSPETDSWPSVTWDRQLTNRHLRQSDSCHSVTWDRQLTQCHLRQTADKMSPETDICSSVTQDSWPSVTWDSQTADPASPETGSWPSVTQDSWPSITWDRQLTQCHLSQSDSWPSVTWASQTADPVSPEPVRQLTQCFLKQEAIFFPFPPIFSAAFLTTLACKAPSVAWMSTLLPPQLTASQLLPLLRMWMPLGSMLTSILSLELFGGQYN